MRFTDALIAYLRRNGLNAVSKEKESDRLTAMRFLAGRAGDATEFRSAFGGVWGGNPSLTPASPVLHAKNNPVNPV